jgi:F-type H+-transporting ATPase subunit epsilon
MSTIRLDFVSQDHMVFTGDVSEVLAPGGEGQMGILPRHAPLMTVLAPGEVVVRQPGREDQYFAVSGGWMEVRPDKVTILARTAERSDEIDLQRAEAARVRAEQLLTDGLPPEDRPGLEMALRRSQIRLKVARKRTRRSSGSSGVEGLGGGQDGDGE